MGGMGEAASTYFRTPTMGMKLEQENVSYSDSLQPIMKYTQTRIEALEKQS